MKILLPAIAVFLLCLAHDTSAQEWMNGYSYRKKITVDKSKVQAIEINAGSSVVKQDLPNFPVLVEIQDNDLIHIPGACGNKMRNAEGRDISFAMSGTPSLPLSFQLENYDPATGKLTCWVKISSLSANGTATPATSFYLYYGSALLHDPFGINGTNLWSGDFSRVWHLKCDVLPAICKDAQSGIISQNATGSAGVNETNFISSKIGNGINLDGIQESFYSSVDTGSSNITVSAWINLNTIGKDQVIIANDSLNGQFRNGYVFKINAAGKLVMELYRSMTSYITTSSATLNPAKWYHVVALISGTQVSLILNGIKVAGSNNIKLGSGGSIRIGRSKQNNGYYSGSIDELRVQKIAKPLEWLKTQYVNQDNPSLFFSVFEEELNPSEFSQFSGSSGGSWALAANWNNGSVPTAGSNVIIPAGKSVHISESSPVTINSLTIKGGAQLLLNNDLKVSCAIQTDMGSSIKLGEHVTLRCSGNFINNGNISISQTTGTLSFSGNNDKQVFSGNGMANVYLLENDQTQIDNELILNAQIQISGFANLKRGILNCNGNLTLVAHDESKSAEILPVPPGSASITGNVNIQQYIAGNFPDPATARNWRLLSSPVYTDGDLSPKQYNISAFKNAMFITGAGGPANGFDPSPLNGGTIYLHDQSLPGNLSQKYTAINNIDTKIVLGKGIYVFSRGSRTSPNAFLNQIQQSPFSNPDGYYLMHTGKVHSGDLTFQLSNKNTESEGDGFNLLGNPYPGSLLWGNLTRVNLSPYIWQYDPLNGDYMVSDAAETRIPIGSGFFVKVISGQPSGSITFSESAKAAAGEISSSNSTANWLKPGTKLSYKSPHSETSNTEQLTITALVSRKTFGQQYRLNFDTNGNDDLDDDDGIKLGEGYINIASIVKNTKLALERRSVAKDIQEVDLYVAGWENGTYTIDLKITTALRKIKALTLIDNYLKQEVKLLDSVNSYTFKIDTRIQETQGNNRFKIKLKPIDQNEVSRDNKNDLIIFPNPVSNKLYFKSINNKVKNARVIITDVLGKIVSEHQIEWEASEPSIDCSNIPKGFYVLKMYDQNSTVIKTFKIIKQ